MSVELQDGGGLLCPPVLQQLFCSVSQTEQRIRAVHSELTATSTLDPHAP